MSETDETSGRGRRQRINILPWVAEEPGQDDGPTSPPARRVPPSGLIAAPSPGAADVPLTPEPWLPPVRRVPPAAEGPVASNAPGWPPTPPHQPPYGTVPAEGFAAPAERNAPHWPGTAAPPRSPDGWAPQAPPPPPPWAAGPRAPQWGTPAGAPWPPAAQAPEAPSVRPSSTEDVIPPVLGLEQPPAPWGQTPAWPSQAPPVPQSPQPIEQRPAAPAAPAEPEVQELPSRRRITADAINHERILGPDQVVPRHGWRARVHSATGGRLNVGLGAGERRYQELLDRVRRPLHGSSQIAISSIKGGVGKTTVAACLGLLMAEYRGDGVVALDADPDAGTLADRLTGEPTHTVRDLLCNLDKIGSLSDFSEFTTLAGRLRVLAGEQDPAMGEAFRREEYEQVCQTLTRYFPIVITDSGTGMVHDVMRGILTSADRLVVVGSLTVDGASRASKTLDWLLAHGHEQLADEAILVLCSDRGSARVDRQQLRDHFNLRCNDVIEIPADEHLYSGGKIEPSLLAPATREAFLNLAAVVADGFR